MLSLPLIAPHPDASLWPSHRTTFDPSHDSAHDSTNTHPRRPNSHHGHGHHHHGSHRSYLATLTADENVISQRKQHIRRFGAGWIRPPGVAKTYQATMDEAAEREEQEALARREQIMMDLAAAQTETQNQEAAAEAGEEMEEEEHDMDDDVPEAEADESNISGSEDEGSVGEEVDTSAVGDQTGMTFNEDSFIEGSMVEAEVEHMLEMEEAEMAGVLQDERDLDDDVPEAGSYEHTDTDLDSSDEEVDDSLISAPSARSRQSRRVSGLSRRSSGARSSRGRNSAMFEGARRISGMFEAGRAASQRVSGVFEGSGRGTSIFDNPQGGALDAGAGRSSFGMDGNSSILDGSSFLRSSPAAARGQTQGSLRSRFMGASGRH